MVSHRDRVQSGLEYRASMEPCLFRHGKDILGDDLYKQVKASMEPCLFRHGKKRIDDIG